MKLAYPKNKRIWYVLVSATILTVIAIGLIVYNMSKSKDSSDSSSISSSVSSSVSSSILSSSISDIEKQEKLTEELQVSAPSFTITPPQGR